MSLMGLIHIYLDGLNLDDFISFHFGCGDRPLNSVLFLREHMTVAIRLNNFAHLIVGIGIGMGVLRPSAVI
jgi:hypothetical protein